MKYNIFYIFIKNKIFNFKFNSFDINIKINNIIYFFSLISITFGILLNKKLTYIY